MDDQCHLGESTCFFQQDKNPELETCTNTACKSHMFWRGLMLTKCHETEISKLFCNCGELLAASGHTIEAEDIAEMWGVARQRILQLEISAMVHLGDMVKDDPDFNFSRRDLAYFEERKALNYKMKAKRYGQTRIDKKKNQGL